MDIKTFHRLGSLFDFNASALTDLIYSLYSTMKDIKGESKREDVNVYIRLYLCKRVCMCVYACWASNDKRAYVISFLIHLRCASTNG